jgi:hypothetical protein
MHAGLRFGYDIDVVAIWLRAFDLSPCRSVRTLVLGKCRAVMCGTCECTHYDSELGARLALDAPSLTLNDAARLLMRVLAPPPADALVAGTTVEIGR